MPNQIVLLVNEDRDSVAIYQALLSQLGYRVFAVDSSEAAVATAAKIQPDVIITELHERTMHGWKTPELLRNDERTSGIPIIALTAWTQKEDRIRARNAGCDMFVAKPVEPRRLATEIAKLLG